MSAPDDLYKLIEKFDRDKPDSETELRDWYVDPLFDALGWDLQAKQQVRKEPSITVREEGLERKKRPDYSFHIGNARHFFVETKMPHINLERNRIPAYQLRRYGWNGKTPVSVLTDFEEFSVYDCRIEPEWNDPANKARLRYYHYGDYIDKWDELESRFSRDAVAGGALREWVEGERIRGAQSVDQSFLRKMEEWRAMLAKAIALHNRDLSQRQLNLLVQRTLDRIVFLRIAEDRDIEAYRRLRSAADDGKQVYEELKILFNEADDKYNSGLFHFGKDERASDPDHDSLRIHIPDEPLRHIIRNLYFPSSPYEFSVMSAEILGQVYEQFLGKVIELSASGAVRVEEKPEVRKAGGVYYTPAYIVDYIVENTVGALLEGKTPAEAAKLRILDPACGSGSFLVGAYQYLLDWHLATYSRAPERHKNVLRRIVGGYLLTTAEKRRILQNNIYGVDLDQNAVEVSKLSLLLKMLENESDATGRQTLMFSAGGRILPDLSDNIKWGNSLIGSDFFRGEQMTLFDNEDLLKVKPFNWDSADGFPAIMTDGGFDAVIGNPPYIRSQSLGGEQREYYKSRYESATRTYDIYVLFVERAISIMSGSGKSGFILPNKFFTTDYGVGIRRVLAQKRLVDRIVDFEDAQVFSQAGTYTTLLFLSHDGSLAPEYVALGYQHRKDSSPGLAEHLSSPNLRFEPLPITDDGSRWTLAPGERGRLLLRLQKKFSIFDELKPHVFQGLKTSADKIYLVSLKKDGQSGLCTVINGLGESATIERQILKPVVKGENVKRFAISNIGQLFIIYPYFRATNGKAELLDPEHLADEFPRTWEYLNEYRAELGARDKGKWSKQKNWYAYARSQNIVTFLGKKYMLPYMSTRLQIALDNHNDLFFVNITTGGYGLRFELRPHHDSFWLGLLNSNLLNWCAKQMTNRFRGGYFAMNKQALERLPIRTIDFANPEDVQMHDEMVKLVDEMLERQRQLPNSTGEGRRITEALIETVDGEIDALVYKLYGLSDDEVAIVEGGLGN